LNKLIKPTDILKIPKGCPIIARRFNAGTDPKSIQVPKERLNFLKLLFSTVPSGLEKFFRYPALKRRAAMGIVKRGLVLVHLFFHLKVVFVLSVLVTFPLLWAA